MLAEDKTIDDVMAWEQEVVEALTADFLAMLEERDAQNSQGED
jgi:hypothetical protein